MKSIIMLTMVGIFMLISTEGKSQDDLFTKVFFDPDGSIQAYSITPSKTNGFAIAGDHNYGGFIIRIDSVGNTLWAKQIEGISKMSHINEIISTPDSCYVLAGVIFAAQSLSPALILVKLNETGNMVWSSITYFWAWGFTYSVKLTHDNGFIATGKSQQTGGSTEKAFISKYSSSGEREWSYFYSTPNQFDNLISVDQLEDNSFIFTGTTYDVAVHKHRMYMIKTTENGIPEWARILNPGNNEDFEGIDVLAEPGGFVFYSAGNSNGIALINTDFQGNVNWAKRYPFDYTSMVTEKSAKIRRLSGGGYAAVTQSWAGELIKFDTSGNPDWVQEIFCNPVDFMQTSDSGFVVVGNGPLIGVDMASTSNPQVGVIRCNTLGIGASCTDQGFPDFTTFNALMEDVVINVETAGSLVDYQPIIEDLFPEVEDGCVAIGGGINETDLSDNSLWIYPNPASQQFSFDCNESNKLNFKRIEVYNNIGVSVFSSNNPASLNEGIDTRSLPDGIYLVRLISISNAYSGKLIIRH
ncbi:MAG: T9SS type A sorting domain-containing protein [Bacteroidales bacterium]|nr:T9SS type A sorting domain-containing protein [Bacteroidales bacterium]